MYRVNGCAFKPSYKGRKCGKSKSREAPAGYGIGVYRFTELAYLLMYREGARTGMVTVDRKPHPAILVENDADALFHKPAATVEEGMKGRPVWLGVDLNDHGRFDVLGAAGCDVRAPFKLGEKTYEAIVPDDGSRLKLTPGRPCVTRRPSGSTIVSATTPVERRTSASP
jgi:hypothetical protein